MRKIVSISWEKLLMALFLIIYCGMWYADFLLLSYLAYVFLFLFIVISISKNKCVYNQGFICFSLIFLVYSFFSSLWSVDYQYTIQNVSILARAIVVSCLFVSCLTKQDNIEWGIRLFMYACIVYALIYILKIDFAMIGARRLNYAMNEDENFPNLNLVSIPVSFSFIYFLFLYIKSRKVKDLLFIIISFLLVVFLGSRKSIISIFLGSILLLLKVDGKKKLKMFLLFLLLISLMLYFIPFEYLEFVYERLLLLLSVNNTIVLDEADLLRKELFSHGIEYIVEQPIIGHGYYSFSKLFLYDYGKMIYSHNNFVEVLVGGGVIGFILYYLVYYKILYIYFFSNKSFDLHYLVFCVFVIMIFNQVGIVLLQNNHTWILLALIYSYSKFKLKVK